MNTENYPQVQLTVDGHVAQPVMFSCSELNDFDAASRIDDVSQIEPRRQGRAVRLRALLERAGLAEGNSVDRLAIHSQDGYRSEVSLDQVIDRAVVVYGLDGGPLPSEAGGPLRFLVPDAAACHTSEIDTCGNVKGLVRLELIASQEKP